MVDIGKLETWIDDNPEAADETFMSVTTQRQVTLRGIYQQLTEERDAGVAIVDEDLMSVIREVDDWLREL